MDPRSSKPCIGWRAAIAHGRALLPSLRPGRLDATVAEERGKERLKRVFWTALSSGLAKGVNALSMLVAVPVTLTYLGAERFGLWMTIASLAAFLGFADLGIGNGVLNIISEACGRNDVDTARKCVSSAVAVLAGIALVLGLLFWLVYPHVAWGRVFNVSSPIASKEAGPATAVFVAVMIANLPLSIIPRVQMAYQEGYISGIWQAASNLLGLVGLLAIARLGAGLPLLVLAFMGAPVVGNLLNAVGLLGFQRPWLVPKRRHVDASVARRIIWVGSQFVMIQVGNAVIGYADNMVIAHALGPEAVARYAVPAKLFALVPMLLYMALAPLWPAFGEANVRGDAGWARLTLARAILASAGLCAIASLVFVGFGERILHLWVGPTATYSLALMIGLGVWTTVSSVLAAIALFLNAANVLRLQVACVLLTAVCATVSKVALARLAGLPAIVWSTVGASILFMLLPYSVYLAKRFGRIGRPAPMSAQSVEHVRV